MKGKEVVHSSKSDEWGTPPLLFEYLHGLFNFQLDAAATKENAKCERYLTEADNGLFQSWRLPEDNRASIWCNPPYSLVKEFTAKAAEETYKRTIESIVFLVPARTDTVWFHNCLLNCSSVYLIKGRLKFVGAGNNSAPFPSCLIIWGEDRIGRRNGENEGLDISPIEFDKTIRGF